MASKTIQQPVTKKQENAADALMAALTNIGQAHKVEQKKSNRTGPPGDRRSRFFFAPTMSFTEDVEIRKKVSLPREVEIVDEQIEARKKTYEKQLPTKLNKNLEQVREFWLNQVAPLALAAQSGSEQARDVINRTLNVEIDSTSFMQFQLMLNQGTKVKLADYVTKYLGLKASDRDLILDVVKVHRPQKEVIYVSDNDRRARTPQPQEENRNLTASEKPKEKEPRHE